MLLDNDSYCCEFKFTKAGKYEYCFNFGGTKYLSDEFRQASTFGKRYRQLVVSRGYKTPNWFKGRVMYQIFPDRFCRLNQTQTVMPNKNLRQDWGGVPNYLPDEKGEILNNDFFGGDILGIISKLNYLKKLGIGAIYLNPIFEAYSNHRYDTADYFKIDSLLGTESHFKKLIKEAAKRDIKIIIDGVFSHTGSDSIYFNKLGTYNSVGAFQSKKSKYFKWYTFKKHPHKYTSWWGVKTLPQVNELEKSYLNFICGKNGVLNYWLSLGVGGVRLDVADELPDKFIEKLRKRVKLISSDNLIIGEVWEDASDKVAYGVRKRYLEGKMLDSVMNYVLKDAIIDTAINSNFNAYRQISLELIDNYPKQTLDVLMNILGTHDTRRILTRLSNISFSSKIEQSTFSLTPEQKLLAVERLKIATILQFMFYGVPSIYYGDEIGMQGFSDPFNRGCFDLKKADKAIANWFKMLTQMRKSQEFISGDYIELYATEKVLVFERRHKTLATIAAINFSDSDYLLTFNGKVQNLITKKMHQNKFKLIANSFALLK